MSTVIKVGTTGPILRRLSTVDLADHLAEAEAVMAEAQRRASQIAATANRDAERLRTTARQMGHREGFDKGYKEGTDRGREAAWDAATCKFDAQHGDIVVAMEKATAEGLGAVTLDGKLIDLASIRQAEGIVKQAEMISAQSGS